MKWRSLEESVLQIEARSLREIYAERKELIAKYVPTEIQAIHARVVAGLSQSAAADRALQGGTRAPAFELPDHNGALARSSDLLAHNHLVICFFRGRWCPFCVGQMEAMSAVVPRLRELRTSMIAISPQTIQQSYFMADQHKLGFPLMSDAGNNVARQFGLVYRVPEYQQEIYRRGFVNLPFTNGDDSWELPIPATYILGREHEVLYASANADYTERPEPADIVQSLANLSQ
jgi:peroxiredoxin